jgi:metal transporter CNNM
MPSRSTGAAGKHSYNGYTSTRTAVVGLAKILFLSLGQLSFVDALPVGNFLRLTEKERHGPNEASLWLYLMTAIILVLLGGVFAGLTIA